MRVQIYFYTRFRCGGDMELFVLLQNDTGQYLKYIRKLDLIYHVTVFTQQHQKFDLPKLKKVLQAQNLLRRVTFLVWEVGHLRFEFLSNLLLVLIFIFFFTFIMGFDILGSFEKRCCRGDKIWYEMYIVNHWLANFS